MRWDYGVLSGGAWWDTPSPQRPPYFRAIWYTVQRRVGGEWKDFSSPRFKEKAISSLMDYQALYPDREFRIYPAED